MFKAGEIKVCLDLLAKAFALATQVSFVQARVLSLGDARRVGFFELDNLWGADGLVTKNFGFTGKLDILNVLDILNHQAAY